MKWEYKIVIEADNYHLRKELNRLGEKGWEAYSTIMVSYADGTDNWIAYLKRPKP